MNCNSHHNYPSQITSNQRVQFEIQGYHVLTYAEIEGWLKKIYQSKIWVYNWLKKQQHTKLLRGRKPVVAGRTSKMPLFVKRIFHGGMLAWITKDLFWSSNRFIDQLKVTDFLIKNHVNTLPVLFATWRSIGPFIRGEVGILYLESGIDAAEYLFPVSGEIPSDWQKIIAQIACLIAELHQLDFLHPDMNLMNFLLDKEKRVYIVDLDKSKLPSKPLTLWKKERNLERLIRSVRKIGENTDHNTLENLIEELYREYRQANASDNRKKYLSD